MVGVMLRGALALVLLAVCLVVTVTEDNPVFLILGVVFATVFLRSVRRRRRGGRGGGAYGGDHSGDGGWSDWGGGGGGAVGIERRACPPRDSGIRLPRGLRKR